MLVSFFILILSSFFFNLGSASKRFDNLRKRFNNKRGNVQQQSRSGSGVSDVSKSETICSTLKAQA